MLVVALLTGAAMPCAGGVGVYSGQHVNVGWEAVLAEGTAEDRMVRFTLRLVSRDGFLPSSFDGVMRDGVMGGATGITGDTLRLGPGGSRFLDDPADMLWVPSGLLEGYVADPSALTGLFALTRSSAIGPIWLLAEVVARPGTNVRLDFTIGQAGSDITESIDVTFAAPYWLPGDADGDADVDLDDFVALKTHFGTLGGATLGEGDFDFDGDVDLDDFVVLKNSFGICSWCSSAPLPEPATLALLAAAGACLPRRPRR
ncbi:MAG: hypothetical protein GX591_03865 [Planctomycetes bacterium]|nr:hypothetical protein [Planctomycetota bacterium]